MDNKRSVRNSATAVFSGGSAASHGLANCHCCSKLSPVSLGSCPRCGTNLHLRKPNSLQMTLALVLTSMLFYIPANIFPIMTTNVLGSPTDSTIISGVILFLEHGSYFVAFVIFTASIIIPIAKMIVILYLCLSVSKTTKQNHYELTRLYRITEFIGKWSMIDVFVVAVLAALVQVGEVMSIQPGIAASAFACVVLLTMLAAQKFDVRLIWDKLEGQ
ncbi:MAG: paraquat-inducible protein A [Arenicella sp.]